MNKLFPEEIKREKDEVYELAIKLFQSWEDASTWINTPTNYFFKYSPLELILTGSGNVVKQFLLKRINKIDGEHYV